MVWKNCTWCNASQLPTYTWQTYIDPIEPSTYFSIYVATIPIIFAVLVNNKTRTNQILTLMMLDFSSCQNNKRINEEYITLVTQRTKQLEIITIFKSKEEKSYHFHSHQLLEIQPQWSREKLLKAEIKIELQCFKVLTIINSLINYSNKRWAKSIFWVLYVKNNWKINLLLTNIKTNITRIN